MSDLARSSGTGLLPSAEPQSVSGHSPCDPSRGPTYRGQGIRGERFALGQILMEAFCDHGAGFDVGRGVYELGVDRVLSAREATAGWQPISTAPRGRDAEGKMQCVLLIAPYPHGTGHWSDIRQGWWDEFGERWERWAHPFPPTHWIPSPAPPAQGIEARSAETSGSAVGESPVTAGHAPDPIREGGDQQKETAA